MAEKCRLDLEKYPEINEISGRFYAFSVQIALDGTVTEEGVQVSPFFYATLCMMQTEGINTHILLEDVVKLNEDVNELIKQNALKVQKFEDVNAIKKIVFHKLGIRSEKAVGLEAASKYVLACKGLRTEEETNDFNSFYLGEIEQIGKKYKENKHLMKYVSSLAACKKQKTMIDSDIQSMQKWLAIDKYPLAKYPSKFSPTLMQQISLCKYPRICYDKCRKCNLTEGIP